MSLWIDRVLSAQIKQHQQWFPIVYLGGPRQSGKTSLLQQLLPALRYVNLENADAKALADTDPRRFLAQFPDGGIIDEAQKVPVLFNYLQNVVDSDKSKRFVLSGSQNFLMMQSITQSLAGRVGILQLLPLSWLELNSKLDLDTFAFTGGYPALHDNRGVPHSIFFNNYVQTYIERDVRMLRNVGDLTLFDRFLRLCAGRVGSPLNTSSLATDVGVSVNTIKAWISILEASYLVMLLPPYYQNFNKRITKTPKMYFMDTGLLCNLLGIETPLQLSTHAMYGHIIENTWLVELYKKRSNTGKRPQFYFWQDSKGLEVDLIIEEDGLLKAIEMKSSQTYNTRLMQGLIRWGSLQEVNNTNRYLMYAGDIAMDTQHGQLMPWQKAISEL
jgi:uncharacterized protein